MEAQPCHVVTEEVLREVMSMVWADMCTVVSLRTWHEHEAFDRKDTGQSYYSALCKRVQKLRDIM